MQMAVDNVQAKETPHVLNTYSVKADFGIFLFIWAFFLFVYQFAMGRLSILEGETFAYGPLFLLNIYVGEGHRAFCVKGQYFFFTLSVQERFFLCSL